MDNLPNEIWIEIFKQIPFRYLIECEIWSKRYHELIRSNQWAQPVRIKNKKQLDITSRYKLSNIMIQGMPNDIELVRTLSKCEKITFVKNIYNRHIFRYLTNVRNITIRSYYNNYMAPNNNDWKFLANTERLDIRGYIDMARVSNGYFNWDGTSSDYFDGVIEKGRGQVIKTNRDFNTHVTKVSNSIYYSKDISKIRRFPNAKKVSLFMCANIFNGIDDIERNLINLTNVTELKLENFTCLTDRGISRLTKLTSLHLIDCTPLTAHGLVHLKNLRELNISKCDNITNNSIKSLVSLDKLTIDDCRSINHNGIKHLTKLRTLSLSKYLNDIDLSPLTRLTELSLTNCKRITDGSLVKLHNLVKLELKYCNQITSYVFSTLHLLDNVTIKSCAKINDDVFKYLSNAQTINCKIKLNPIADPSIMASLTNVRDLVLYDTTITATLLKYFARIEKLKLVRCDIINYRQITYMQSLTNLTLIKCKKMTDYKMQHFRHVTKLAVIECDNITSGGLSFVPDIKEIVW